MKFGYEQILVPTIRCFLFGIALSTRQVGGQQLPRADITGPQEPLCGCLATGTDFFPLELRTVICDPWRLSAQHHPSGTRYSSFHVQYDVPSEDPF